MDILYDMDINFFSIALKINLISHTLQKNIQHDLIYSLQFTIW